MAENAKQLAARARGGRFREVLPALRALVVKDGPRALGQRAQAAAVLMSILFWQEAFAEAADLAEELITADGPRDSPIRDEDEPFSVALLAAEVHAGQPAAARCARLASSVPADSVLGERLTWLATELADRSAVSLLPNYSPWGEPPSPLDGVIGADYLDDDYSELKPNQQRALWNALLRTNQFERGWDLHERVGLPPQWEACVWLAGWCATLDRTDEGRRILLAAHDLWWPYAVWDCLPPDPVVQPVLRGLVTDEVREHYLTHPIGPEREKR
jgi:hypothetical protein